MKRLLSLILVITIVLIMCPIFSVGALASDDLPQGAIAIGTIEELDMICNEYPADGYYYLANDIDMSDATGSQYGDFYRNGKGWTPIGTTNTPFKGTFDGRGHKIIGLNINDNTCQSAGLFAYISNACIKNLIVEESNVVGGTCAGILVGTASNSTIDNVSIDSSNVVAKSVAGMLGGKGTSMTVTKCCNKSNYTDEIATYGGLFGTFSGSIISCSNIGAISGTIDSDVDRVAGGLIGEVVGTTNISDSFNKGNISLSSSYTIYYSASGKIGGVEVDAGGLIGLTGNNNITIDHCYNCANVNVTSTETGYAAGFIAYIDGLSSNAITISSSYSKGDIYASQYGSSVKDYSFTAGGIVGRAGIGLQYTHTKLTVKNCYYVGTTSSRQSSYATAIVGFLGAGDSSISTGGILTLISNCYAIGPTNIIYDNFSTKNKYSTVTNCYFCSDSSTNAMARTDRQLRTQATFENWDFDDTWTMDGNEDYLYPEIIGLPMEYKKSLLSISIASPFEKETYIEGLDSLDVTGGQIKATYDNDTNEKIDITNDMVSGFNNTIVGQQELTITYGGKSIKYNIKVNHDLVHLDDVEATCLEDGTVSCWLCNACGKCFRDAAATSEIKNNAWIIPAINHKYGDWTKLDDNQHQRVCANDPTHVEKANHNWVESSTIDATCTTDGGKTYECSDCGATKTEIIPALTHNYGAWTKLDDNQHQRVCANDPAHVEKAKHNWALDSVVNATCTTDGGKTYKCLDCGATKTETIAKINHNYEAHKCKVCGKIDSSYKGLVPLSNDKLGYYVNGEKVESKTGLVKQPDASDYYAGKYVYLINGEVQETYTGIMINGIYGYRYVVNGVWADTKTGLVKQPSDSEYYAGQYVYLEKGKMQDSYTGIMKNGTYGYRYVVDGIWADTKTGLVKQPTDSEYYANKYVYLKKGKMQDSYTGIMINGSYGYRYVVDGVWADTKTGLVKQPSDSEYYASKYVYLKKGKMQDAYTGVMKNGTYGYRYVVDGVWADTKTGLVKQPSNSEYYAGKYVYIKSGKIQDTFTGIMTNGSYGKRYVKNGVWADTYSGKVKYDGKTYTVKKGKVV